MKYGGISDSRNKALMKMFNIIGIGERTGSGVSQLFAVWNQEGWEEPIIEPYERTILMLSFKNKVEIKNAEINAKINVEIRTKKKTIQQYDMILNYMKDDEWYNSIDFLEILKVKERRVQTLLKELAEKGLLLTEGTTKLKKYKRVKYR